MNPRMKKICLLTWRHNKRKHCTLYHGDRGRSAIIFVYADHASTAMVERDRSRTHKMARKQSGVRRVRQMLGYSLREVKGL